MILKDICYHIPKSASSDDEIRRILDSGSSLDEFDINFTLMGCSGISFKDLQNMVKRNQVEIGDYILTLYYRDSTPLIAWKVIDKIGGKVTLNTIDVIDFIPFSKNGSSDYQKSDIRNWMNNVFLNKLSSNFVSFVNRYSSKDEIIRGDKFWLLSHSEIEDEYYPDENDRVKYSLIDCWFLAGDTCFWWVRTTSDKYYGNQAYVVDDLGKINDYSVINKCGCSPACIFG